MKHTIRPTIEALMESIFEQALVKEPLAAYEHGAGDPLHAVLVPEVILQAARFERRFDAAFGIIWQELAVVAAVHGLGFGAKNHPVQGVVKEGRLRRIAAVMNRPDHLPQEGFGAQPNWNEELAYIMQGRGQDIPVTVNCDVYAEDPTSGDKYAFELKAPLLKSDQTKVSKEKLLKLYCMEPSQITGAYFALPYNPYGKREAYAWSYPGRWFDMKRDEVVLIGDEFWDKIGGLGTYQAFIAAVNEIGVEYKERIYREYLGIEPPRPQSEGNL
jgi:hypothetical protein